MVVDPLAEVVTLLQPGAPFSKVVSGAGPWRVRRSESGRPFYCVILGGSCHLAVDGHESITLQAGDFVLIPAAYDFTMSSLQPVTLEDSDTSPVALLNGEFRLGIQSGPPDVRSLVGYCAFGSPDAALLVSLLPQLVHVRGERRLATLVQLVGEESRELRPARDVILARLLEVLFIEALRSTAGTAASPGLLRGLADGRLAVAIRRMHESPALSWTVAQLAKEAALSRSAFFERFSRAVGSRRWSTCSLGAWLWQRTCCGGRTVVLPRSRNVWATALPAHSASHSRAMWDCRRRGMHGST